MLFFAFDFHQESSSFLLKLRLNFRAIHVRMDLRLLFVNKMYRLISLFSTKTSGGKIAASKEEEYRKDGTGNGKLMDEDHARIG